MEQENSKLKRLVANLSLDNLVLKDFASKLVISERRRIAADHAQKKHGMTVVQTVRAKGAEEGSGEVLAGGIDDVALDVREMECAEDGEEQEPGRGDAGETDSIED